MSMQAFKAEQFQRCGETLEFLYMCAPCNLYMPTPLHVLHFPIRRQSFCVGEDWVSDGHARRYISRSPACPFNAGPKPVVSSGCLWFRNVRKSKIVPTSSKHNRTHLRATPVRRNPEKSTLDIAPGFTTTLHQRSTQNSLRRVGANACGRMDM